MYKRQGLYVYPAGALGLRSIHFRLCRAEYRLSLIHIYRAYAKRALDTILNNEADASQNYALLVFDIDFFKSANDEFGHLFGDQVLANVAHRIQANVRKSDISARIGGDEFLILSLIHI